MLSDEERKELEMLKKDEDVKRARKRIYNKEKQQLYKLRYLKKKGMQLRESGGEA